MAAPPVTRQVRRNAISYADWVKSFVDDSSRERAIVSLRVISVSRSTETRLVLWFVMREQTSCLLLTIDACSMFVAPVTPPQELHNHSTIVLPPSPTISMHDKQTFTHQHEIWGAKLVWPCTLVCWLLLVSRLHYLHWKHSIGRIIACRHFSSWNTKVHTTNTDNNQPHTINTNCHNCMFIITCSVTLKKHCVCVACTAFPGRDKEIAARYFVCPTSTQPPTTND